MSCTVMLLYVYEFCNELLVCICCHNIFIVLLCENDTLFYCLLVYRYRITKNADFNNYKCLMVTSHVCTYTRTRTLIYVVLYYCNVSNYCYLCYVPIFVCIVNYWLIFAPCSIYLLLYHFHLSCLSFSQFHLGISFSLLRVQIGKNTKKNRLYLIYNTYIYTATNCLLNNMCRSFRY